MPLRRYLWPALGAIILLGALIVAVAPVERTIGEGIKIVYVHVALTWAAEAGLIVAGLLGLAVLALAHPALAAWMRALGWIGLAFLAAGTAVSLVAEQVVWGGIAWREPRTIAALQLLAAAIIVQVVNTWLPVLRVRGLLSAALAVYLLWSLDITPLVLHPANPIRTSSSIAIQAVFVALFVLCLLAEGLLAAYGVAPRRGDAR